MLNELDWICIELYIKYRVFIFIYKLKKGLIRGIDNEVKSLLLGVNNKGTRFGDINWNFYRDSKVDKMIFYKGIREYNRFKCNELEGLNLLGFKKNLMFKLRIFQNKNWGESRLRVSDYRDWDIG